MERIAIRRKKRRDGVTMRIRVGPMKGILWSRGSIRAMIAALSVAVFAAATTPAYAAPLGLVAAYSFDEGTGTTVADASGAGNSGTVANTAWVNTGKFGNALSFNGTSARVNVPNSSSLQ